MDPKKLVILMALLTAPVLLSLSSSPLSAATPNWNGCTVSDYPKEFMRNDQLPFGKRYAEWTDADFAELRRRIIGCIDPYFAARGRREFYLSNVDAHIEDYKTKKQSLIRQADEREQQSRANAERAKQEQERSDRTKTAATQYRAAVRKWLDDISALDRETTALPVNPKSIPRLDEIAKAVAPIGDVNSMDAFLRSAHFPSEQQSLDNARNALTNRIREKRDASVKVGLSLERTAFRARAKTESANRASEIAKLGLDDLHLNAEVMITGPSQAEPFASLREIVALLLANDAGTLSAVRYRNNGDLGLGIKKPGQQTITYGFRMDGGELYLVRYEERGMHEYLTNLFEKAMVENQLRDAVGWPKEWSGKTQ